MNNNEQKKNPVFIAATMFGSQQEFAKALGVTRQCVNKWIQQGEVPMRKVQKVSDLTKIPIWELNPTYCKKPSRTIIRTEQHA